MVLFLFIRFQSEFRTSPALVIIAPRSNHHDRIDLVLPVCLFSLDAMIEVGLCAIGSEVQPQVTEGCFRSTVVDGRCARVLSLVLSL